MTDHGSTGTGDNLRQRRKSWRKRLQDEKPEHYCVQCLSIRFDDDARCLDCNQRRPDDGWKSLELCEDRWLGRVIDGRYLISSTIGRGSSGDVYRGESMSISRQFAVKIIATDRRQAQAEQVIERLNREIEALSQLRNPHIVSIYEILDLHGRFAAAVMDLIEGVTLEELVTTKDALGIERACSLIRQTANGIYGAHQAGMIHRDLKPENLMVERLPAGDDFVHILDFGIVRLTDDTSTSLTHGFIGTPLYASPEQATGKETDHRSDIYSLGAILFFTLTGKPPFPSDNVYEVLRMHVRKPPPRLDEVDSSREYPEPLQDLVNRMLAKRPADRPDDLSVLIHQLDQCLRRHLSESSVETSSTDDSTSRAPASGVLKVPDNFDPRQGYDPTPQPERDQGQSRTPASGVLKTPDNFDPRQGYDPTPQPERAQSQSRTPASGVLKKSDCDAFDRDDQDSSATIKAYDERNDQQTPMFQRQPTPASSADESIEAIPGNITFTGDGHQSSSGATAIPSATYQLRTPVSEVQAAYRGNGLFAILEQSTGEIRRFESDSTAPSIVPVDEANTIETIALRDDELIAGHDQGSISRINPATGRQTELYQDVRRTPISAVTAADDECIAAGSVSGRVYVSDHNQTRSADWRRIRTGESVRTLTISDDAELLAVARQDNSIEIFRPANPRVDTGRFRVDAPVRSMSISPDNYLLAVSLVDRTLALFQLPTGRQLLSLQTEHLDVLAISFGSDANPVAVCSLERQIRLLKFDQINAHAI